MIKHNIKNTILTIICWMATVVFVFPLIWFAMLSLKEPSLTLATPPVLFFKPTFQAYYDVIVNGNTIDQLWNSLIVAGGSTFLCLVIGLPAAYAFSRFTFRFKRDALFTFLSIRMAPPIAVLLPFYMLMRNLDLLGTHVAMIILNITVNLPLFIWLMRDFFSEVSISLDDSAMIDGCSRFQAFWRVILPLALPGIVVSTVFVFIFSWNEFLFASIFSNSDTQTLTVGATSFWTNARLEWNKLAAVAIITVLPPLTLSFILTKYMIRGLTFGAVKG